MPNIECQVEDQDKKFQITLEVMPRMGEFLIRGGTQYVVASITWNVSSRRSYITMILRELLPDP